MAKEAGCQVKSGVSRKVTMLVLGVQDPKRLAGHKKSGKHRKAEKLIEKGHDIKIISGHDFLEMCTHE